MAWNHFLSALIKLQRVLRWVVDGWQCWGHGLGIAAMYDGPTVRLVDHLRRVHELHGGSLRSKSVLVIDQLAEIEYERSIQATFDQNAIQYAALKSVGQLE